MLLKKIGRAKASSKMAATNEEFKKTSPLNSQYMQVSVWDMAVGIWTSNDEFGSFFYLVHF